jgi:hypothetical protein
MKTESETSTPSPQQSPASPAIGARPEASTPAIVSADEWKAARDLMLVKEKAFTRARDALAAERRRMPAAAARSGQIRCPTSST